MTETFYRLEVTTNVWLVRTLLSFPLGRFIFSGSGSLETRGQVTMAQNRWFWISASGDPGTSQPWIGLPNTCL